MKHCKHYFCRCKRSEELMRMGQAVEAIAVHALDEEVQCRTCCPACGAPNTAGAICTPCHELNRDAFRPTHAP